MQQGMFFSCLAAPDSDLYIIQLSCTLRGNLDTSAFSQAWKHMIARHPVLRTSFHWGDLEKPLQAVHQQASLPLEQCDWCTQTPTEQKQRLSDYLKTDHLRSFRLDKAPLMRLTLIRLTENSYHFIWSFHHMLMEGWSVSLLLKEVFTFYDAIRSDQDIQLEHRRPYRDYILWLHQQNQPEAESYWRRTLKNFTAPTPLGAKRAADKPLKQVIDCKEQRFSLSVATTEALQSLVKHNHLTLNTVVQGCWGLLLSRYSGEEDVVFGNVVSGRPVDLTGAESMVGLFINTLPVRLQISSEAPLLPWLKQLQTQQVEMRQYEYSSLVDIQGWSEIPRDRPLFESILVFQNWLGNRSFQSWNDGLQISDIQYTEGGSGYPLTIGAFLDAGLSLSISYDCYRFSEAAIARMLGHLKTLLEGIVADPERCSSNLSLLTRDEQQQLLIDWNSTQTDFPRDHCVHELFEAQVKTTPDATAIIYEDKTLTYRELNTRANQLARHLRQAGVGAETCVGICIERSLEMVIGLLGILKAGGAYVPLDPTYPKERLAFMIEDTGIAVLLSQAHLLSRLPDTQAPIVCLDRDWTEIANCSEKNLSGLCTAENLVYITYTSGSTGTPKGVEVLHHGVTRLLFGIEYAELGPEQVFLQLAPLSFDASTFELWGALLHGARCVLFPEHVPDARQLDQVLQAHDVSILWLTSSLFNSILDEAPETLSGIRQLLVGGEALSVEHVRRALDKLPHTQLINGYGPTESTTFTCCYRIPAELDSTLQSLPIGRPIGNTRVYILDPSRQPVPVGVPGELYIGGDGLARGYLNHPKLTAERFIPDPFSHDPKARLYRTGDRVRYLADGNIEYLGRMDRQLKIRGFRIEPGEIEAMLAGHPDVRQAVVMAREDVPGYRRLVAYVVTNNESATSELRSFLKQKLPEYMLPSVFVPLDALPLTDNGKIDYRALPEPDTSRSQSEEQYIAPRNIIELQLAETWEEILGVKAIGINDDFFDLGGHSLLSVRLLSRMDKEHGIRIPLANFFRGPTIAQTARTILQQEESSTPPALLIPIQPLGSKRPFFFVAGGGGSEAELVFGYGRLARHLGTDQPFYGLRARGTEGEDTIQAHAKEIAADLIKEMCTVQAEGPYLLGGGCIGGIIAFEIAQQLKARGEKVELLLLMESVLPNSMTYRHLRALSVKNNLARRWRNQRLLMQRLYYHARNLPRLASERRLQYLLDKVRKVKKLRTENKEQHETKRIRQNYQKALFRYAPKPYPGRLTLLVAEEESHSNPTLGWEGLAIGGIEVHKIPGDHTSHLEIHFQATAKQMKACLDAAQASG